MWCGEPGVMKTRQQLMLLRQLKIAAKKWRAHLGVSSVSYPLADAMMVRLVKAGQQVVLPPSPLRALDCLVVGDGGTFQ